MQNTNDEVKPRAYNEAEIALIQATFADNEELLKSVRALFLGLEITEPEEKLIQETFRAPELRAIFWKRFLPQLDRNVPLGQEQDIWMGVEEMVFGHARDTITQAIEYKRRAIAFTEQALRLLENPRGRKFTAHYDPELVVNDELAITLLARNQFIKHVNTQLFFLWTIAQMKAKTPAEASAAKKKNSSE